MSEWHIKGRRPKYPDEAWVKKQIKDQLEQLKKETERLWYYMPNGGYFSISGVPDFMCIFSNLGLGIEAKDTDGKWSEAQQKVKQDMIDAGGCYILVDEDGLFKLWETLWLSNTLLEDNFFDLRGVDK